MESVKVLKADGAIERFDVNKLIYSLENSGASKETASEVARHVEKELVTSVSTADIYRHAFSVLHGMERKAAARYSLRRSLLALGPTGFPFEKFVGEIFKKRGYSILLDQNVQGRCVDHEIDIVAWNDNSLIMTEAKYHHELAYKSDLKVVLYIKARFDDLAEGTASFGKHKKMTEGLLITNTKFTDKAIAYCKCANVRLVGWNYPASGNLHDLIEETGLHPVTCLTTLSDAEKRILMDQGVVLCESIRNEKEKMRGLGFDDHLIKAAEAESSVLCPA